MVYILEKNLSKCPGVPQILGSATLYPPPPKKKDICGHIIPIRRVVTTPPTATSYHSVHYPGPPSSSPNQPAEMIQSSTLIPPSHRARAAEPAACAPRRRRPIGRRAPVKTAPRWGRPRRRTCENRPGRRSLPERRPGASPARRAARPEGRSRTIHGPWGGWDRDEAVQ